MTPLRFINEFVEKNMFISRPKCSLAEWRYAITTSFGSLFHARFSGFFTAVSEELRLTTISYQEHRAAIIARAFRKEHHRGPFYRYSLAKEHRSSGSRHETYNCLLDESDIPRALKLSRLNRRMRHHDTLLSLVPLSFVFIIVLFFFCFFFFGLSPVRTLVQSE